MKNKSLQFKLFFLVMFCLGFFVAIQNASAATEVVHTIKPSGQGGDYTTLAAWEAGEQRDLTAADEIAVAQIDGNWSAPDTTQVSINGWTTDATRYIKIYTTETARHGGKWDNAKYRLSLTASATYYYGLRNYEDYVRVDGLQIDISGGASAENMAFYSGGVNASDIRLSNNVIKCSITTGTANRGIAIGDTDTVASIWNNIIYNLNFNATSRGIEIVANTAYLYNNTLVDNTQGIGISGGAAIAKNNIVKGSGNTNSYIGTFAAGTDYNATDGTDNIGQGTNNRISQAFAFANEANDDFHLANSDTAAKNAGADLSADANLPFNTDIDGQSRPAGSAWDIGADEQMGAVLQSGAQKAGSLTNGLVMYQSFDGADVSGTNAYDRSGLGNNGTISGATAAIGKRGQALSFDGNDSISLSNDVSAYLNMTNGSITFWYKTNSSSGASDRIFSFINNGDMLEVRTGDSDHLVLESQVDYGAYHNVVASIPNIATDNDWHYAVASWDVNGGSETLALTIDGVRTTDSDAIATPSAYGGTAYVGSAYGVQDFWNGSIDEFRVYERVLSADEIGDLYRLGQEKINMSLTDKNTSGLVGMWSFDGPNMDWSQATAEARDISGNGNHGDVVGPTVTTGKTGQALNFNGTTDYVRITDDSEIEGLTQLTVSAWVKSAIPNKAVGTNYIINDHDSSSFYLAWTQGEDVSFHVYNNAAANGGGQYSDGILDTNWHHVVGVYNGTDIRVYVDNVLGDVVGTWSDPIRTTSSSLDISSSGASWNGKIDEVRIYSRALSASEIGDLYRLGQAKIKR
jgi:hypothetical protein